MSKDLKNADKTENIDIDTIAARATPPGRGGIAIIRISGPRVKRIMQGLLGRIIEPRKATYLPFRDDHTEILDEGVALFFPQPHSFTGEDVLELHGHGGAVISDLLLKQIVKAGARLAQPGEFSLRAFLNDKIDLAQAEAIADLIDASSKQAARSAMRSLQGEFSKVIQDLNERIIQARMHMEAAIDFSHEDIDFISDGVIANQLKMISDDLRTIQNQAKQGSFLRDGVNAVIVGKPNVGKSSLLNRLSGKETAIVTNIPGTTRDIIRDDIILDGMPLHIMDTAGLRESEDIVETEGVRRAYHAMESADIILYMDDEDRDDIYHGIEHSNGLLPNLKVDDRYLFIRNKIDLLNQTPSVKQSVIALSAKTGAGVDLLIKAIKTKVGFNGEHEGVFLARRRHLEALANAQVHMETTTVQFHASSYELAAEELRRAQQALSRITGEFSADDLLGRIFSSFCIGK